MHPGLVEDGETSIRNTLAALRSSWNGAGDGRIQIWFGPRTPGGVTPSLYDEISKLARERNMGITIHNSEVSDDLAYAAVAGLPVRRSSSSMTTACWDRARCWRTVVWTDEADWKLMAADRDARLAQPRLQRQDRHRHRAR